MIPLIPFLKALFGDLTKKPCVNSTVTFLMHFSTSHLRHFKSLFFLTPEIGVIDCSRAAESEPGNVWRRAMGERLSGSLNGLYFRSTPRAAESNYDGIKITCSWVASSKQQFRDPLLSSINESLKMHLCREDGSSLSALIDYELFSWWVKLAGMAVCCWLTCSWFFLSCFQKVAELFFFLIYFKHVDGDVLQCKEADVRGEKKKNHEKLCTLHPLLEIQPDVHTDTDLCWRGATGC